MYKSIKDKAREMVGDNTFRLFVPIFLIFLVNTALTSMMIGAIISYTFICMTRIFVRRYTITGKVDAGSIINDYASSTTVLKMIAVGAIMCAINVACMLPSFLVSFIAPLGQDEGIVLIAALLMAIFAIIGGIVMAIFNYMFFFVGYILFDSNFKISAADAFKLSARMTKGHKWQIFMLHLSMIGQFLLCIITLGIYRIWFAPVQYTAESILYQKIKVDYMANSGDSMAMLIKIDKSRFGMSTPQYDSNMNDNESNFDDSIFDSNDLNNDANNTMNNNIQEDVFDIDDTNNLNNDTSQDFDMNNFDTLRPNKDDDEHEDYDPFK